MAELEQLEEKLGRLEDKINSDFEAAEDALDAKQYAEYSRIGEANVARFWEEFWPTLKQLNTLDQQEDDAGEVADDHLAGALYKSLQCHSGVYSEGKCIQMLQQQVDSLFSVVQFLLTEHLARNSTEGE